MYIIEADPAIGLIFSIFFRIGFWAKQDETVYCSAFRKLFFFLSYVSYPVLTAIGALQNDNNDDLIFSSVVAYSSAVFLVKLFYILLKQEEILEFTNKIGFHSINSFDDFTKAKEKLKFFMNFSYCFSFMAFSQIIFVSIFPILNEKKLPFNVGILDWKNDAASYWITYTYIILSVAFSAIINFFTIIIWYLILNASIKFEVVGNQFQNMFASEGTKEMEKAKNISEAEKQNWFLQDFITSIRAHQNIQRTTDQFKSCFNNLFFIQITTGSISICGSIYTFVFINENLFQSMIFAIVLIYNMFEIFMVTYLSNEITLSSDRFSYRLFECNWPELPIPYKKCLIILIEALQHPMKLVVGELYPLNLETFTSILKLAYSLLNVLQKLVK